MRLFLTMLAALALAVPALAGPGPAPLGSGAAKKTCPAGKLVVNATQRVVNDVDQGTKGNYWARDSYSRLIKVWRTGAGKYCAVVTYIGKFVTIAGASPGGTTTLPAGLKGTFIGAYRVDFTATPKAKPDESRFGFIGEYDYACTDTGDCPGAKYWAGFYFTGIQGDDLDWWRWVYTHRGSQWINASTGTTGDIVAKPTGKP